eukprot:9488450-Pyramimonas_sp.AAC.2
MPLATRCHHTAAFLTQPPLARTPAQERTRYLMQGCKTIEHTIVGRIPERFNNAHRPTQRTPLSERTN